MTGSKRSFVLILVLAAAGASLAAAATGKTFTSARYHYSVVIPAGWTNLPATTNLKPGFFPDGDGAETDKFTDVPNAEAPTVGIASVKVKTGTTLAQWTAGEVAAIKLGYDCLNPTRSTRRLAGEPTSVLIYKNCVGLYFIEFATVHNGRGYDVYWLSGGNGKPAALAQSRAIFNRFAATFRFTS